MGTKAAVILRLCSLEEWRSTNEIIALYNEEPESRYMDPKVIGGHLYKLTKLGFLEMKTDKRKQTVDIPGFKRLCGVTVNLYRRLPT